MNYFNAIVTAYKLWAATRKAKRIAAKQQKHPVAVFTHLVGLDPVRLSSEEKLAIINVAPLMSRIFSEKLLVVNSKNYDVLKTANQQELLNHVMFQAGRVSQLEELIHFLDTYEKRNTASDKIPLSRNF